MVTKYSEPVWFKAMPWVKLAMQLDVISKTICYRKSSIDAFSEELALLNLRNQGYSELKFIPGRGLCAITQMIFTTAIVYGLSKDGCYEGRYCYPNRADAIEALKIWDGQADPPDEFWVAHKGNENYPNPQNDIYGIQKST